MAAVLPTDVAERLAKLLGMLGSAHEGEALTAARLGPIVWCATSSSSPGAR